MNVLLTGATGFVGRNILRVLTKRGYTVYCIVRRELDNHKNIFLIKLKNPDKCDYKFYSKLLTEFEINSIIHAAAITGEKFIHWIDYYYTNVLWTRNLALGFIKSNVTHKKFVFISTVGVYGTIPRRLPADETTGYNPDCKYHLSKVLAEKELLKFREVLKNNPQLNGGS